MPVPRHSLVIGFVTLSRLPLSPPSSWAGLHRLGCRRGARQPGGLPDPGAGGQQRPADAAAMPGRQLQRPFQQLLPAGGAAGALGQQRICPGAGRKPDADRHHGGWAPDPPARQRAAQPPDHDRLHLDPDLLARGEAEGAGRRLGRRRGGTPDLGHARRGRERRQPADIRGDRPCHRRHAPSGPGRLRRPQRHRRCRAALQPRDQCAAGR